MMTLGHKHIWALSMNCVQSHAASIVYIEYPLLSFSFHNEGACMVIRCTYTYTVTGGDKYQCRLYTYFYYMTVFVIIIITINLISKIHKTPINFFSRI